jgi:3-oxoacyl-(acyl-carrier-protein) synthase
MIKVRGWIKEGQCGCNQKGLLWQYTDLRSLYAQLLKDTVLKYPIENFARFDQASKFVTLSVALVLYDAGITYTKDKKQNIGILGMSLDGAFTSNLAYFKDYVEAGRKLGRGNLFIYTLPSSPLAEAAIHFGLQGPLVYIRSAEKPRERLLAQAQLMIQNKEAQAMIAVDFSSTEATCYFISGEKV